MQFQEEQLKQAELPILLPKCVLSRTGAVFGELSREEWLEIWRRLECVDASLNWIRGDWFNAGEAFLPSDQAYSTEDEKGQAIAQLIPADGPSRKTLWNLAYVARKVPTSLRREVLSWSHHKEIAPLPPAQQRSWLARAEKENWSVADLREALFAEARGAKGKPLFTFVPMSWGNEFMRWLGEERIDRWPVDRQRTLARQLKPLLERLRPLLAHL